MRHELIKVCKKYKLSIIIGLIIIIVGITSILLLTLGNGLSIKEYKNSNYIVKYDSSWKIVSKSDNSINFKHKKGSKLNIEIVELQEEYKFSNIETIIDELLYDLEVQNKDFKLLYKEKDIVTKNKYDGYRLLYENEDSQAMVVIAKKSDNLILFTYEAKNNYFDILLDSAQNIIYDFNTVEEKINLTHKLNIETQKINYNKSKSVESLLNNKTQHEIATKNYFVKYSIPSNFKLKNINSQSGYFDFEGLKDGTITMTVNLYNKNIYEYLDKTKSLNIYTEYKSYKGDKRYSEFTESLDKFNSDFESYIYKCNFYDENAVEITEDFEVKSSRQLRDNIILVYALDRNHILLINIESKKVAIPKKMIEMIKIDSSKNYSSFINLEKEDGMIKSKLKRYVGTERDLEEITISIPEKYKEEDKDLNIYERRSYVLDFNQKLEIYNYEIEYSVLNEYLKLEGQIEQVNNSFSKSYGNYKEMTYFGEKNINGKKFSIYDGGYTDLSGILFTNINRYKYYINVKVLFYELPNGGHLMIKIKGNNNQISDQMLNEITNFEIKTNKEVR